MSRKSNTSRAVFTSHERAMARVAWGANSARLNRDSFLPFAACRLCLEPARDPVGCAAAGDIYCRECALSNILAQRKEIKRLDKAREREAAEAAQERGRLEAEERERAVREFELVQVGLGGRARMPSRDAASEEEEAATSARRQEEGGGGGAGAGGGGGSTGTIAAVENSEKQRGEKRKFELDEQELARIASEDRAKARRAIEDEKAAKPTLPSFWTPSITPSSNKNNTLHEVKRKTKSSPVCPASPADQPHPYSLHTLVTVHFSEEVDAKTKERQRVCPACKKALTNASKAVLAKPCGHVLCGSCVRQFMTPAGHDPHAPESEAGSVRCYVCDADLTDNRRRKTEKGDRDGDKDRDKDKDKDKIRPGLVSIRSEGTGFSAAGANEVKKNGVNYAA